MENKNKILLAVALASFFTGGLIIGYAWGHSSVTIKIGGQTSSFDREKLNKQLNDSYEEYKRREQEREDTYNELMAKLEADSKAKQEELDREAQELRERRNDNFEQLGKTLTQ